MKESIAAISKPSVPFRSGFDKKSSAADAFAHFLAETGLAAGLNLAASLRSADPAPPHQTRVALRRLRTALWAYKHAIAPEPAEALAEAAKLFAAQVGAVRDADVLALEILPTAAPAIDPEVYPRLQAAVEAHRADERKAFLNGGATVDGAALLLALHRYQLLELWKPAKLGCKSKDKAARRARNLLQGPTEALADAALKRAYAKAARWGDRIDSLSVEERHEMRKALKRLRYTASFFSPLYAQKRVRPFLGHLRALQNAFGYLNDVAGAERLRDVVAAVSAPAAERAVLLNAAGRAIAHHQAAADAAWGKARARWSALAKTRRFWRD